MPVVDCRFHCASAAFTSLTLATGVTMVDDLRFERVGQGKSGNTSAVDQSHFGQGSSGALEFSSAAEMIDRAAIAADTSLYGELF